MKSFESRSSVEYPRKRASIACNFCRHRKRKCDGQKPTCGLCTDAGAHCVYQESERVQDIPSEILARLTHLETLIEEQRDAIKELTIRVSSASPQSDQVDYRPKTTVYPTQPRYDWDPSPDHVYGDRSLFGPSSLERPYSHPFSITPGHHTPTGSLFALGQIKELIGEYPEDFFRQLEWKRPLLGLQLPGVPRSFEQIDRNLLLPQVTKPLINEFLKCVHPFFPIIDPQLLQTLFETFSTYTKVNSVQTSLYLLILALGKVSSNPERIFDIEADKELNGMEYFAPAYNYVNDTVVQQSSMADELLPLALFFASLYLRYIGRPIPACFAIQSASRTVQHVITEQQKVRTVSGLAPLYRTAWGCFILECDDLAEFEFPPTNIQDLADRMPFPEFPAFGDPEESRQCHTLFLAMTSIRKILNSVHNTLYAKPQPENYHSSSPSRHASETPSVPPQKQPIASLKTISKELDRQVEVWVQSIPAYARPSLNSPIFPGHPYHTPILARYYATKHIIGRPSLLYAANNQTSSVLPEYIWNNCTDCVINCRKFLQTASILLRKRTHSTWLRTQAVLAAIFTLAIAKRTPSLEALVPDFDELVAGAIKSIEPWARHSESSDTVVGMLKTIRQKMRVMVRGHIQGVRLAGQPSTWDIQIEYSAASPRGKVTSVTPHESARPTSETIESPLALPALTHPHIHLDKAFIHSAPEYAAFLPSTGTFQEALSSTTKAKQQFNHSDLLKRGEWLLAESTAAGVTAMRAFVEVDHTVQLVCLDAAVALQSQWKDICDIQIVCFAQDPIFSTEHGDQNMKVLELALQKYPQVDVLGTTPYVESSVEAAKQNIDWAISRALQLDKHVDFHLDYNLDSKREPLLWHVLQTLKQRNWTAQSTDKRVMLGHCTRLTLLTETEWTRLATEIKENNLPVSFVGLPTSDIYMASAGVRECGAPQDRPRGTLQVLEMIKRYGLDAVIGVNNVGNSFTPWGLPDPLALACLGVGIYQAGSQADAELLYECVSTRARKAIGLGSSSKGLCIVAGRQMDLLVVHCRDETGCGVGRPRRNVAEVVWTPPGSLNRDVVFGGHLRVSPFVDAESEGFYQFG
ncbi:Phytanoyl-CoA dioxygenase [Penicillium bovifimosum]|uniref:Phytanoyl-CoA dioxygenase n=1 Tax=Penicillium bovifimosum TaxID=126998 RepID=A0A9W9KUY1_9EURO|nr:Phytanoyl-CoA dioxygenase [Penicillium bovifimosum]KAJ5120365.1 Phytanoyl-CoA dioxygenase [Penicillium bovifimosum]